MIVLVEDNPADVALMRHICGELDDSVEFRVLSDGEQALRFVDELRSVEERLPCVILVDLHLPRYDGSAVLRAIAREPVLADVQVAVWTTLASPREREEVLELGAALYEIKPTSLDGFSALAARLIGLCHGRAYHTAS